MTSPFSISLDLGTGCMYSDGITRSGTFVITPEKGDVKTIDFGDGTCDNKATVKIGDKTTDITL